MSISAILTQQAFLYKNISSFFFRNEISEDIGDLKGRGCVFNVAVSKNKTFFAIKYIYLGSKKIASTLLENRM